MSLQHRRDGAVAFVALANPPVNAFSRALRIALLEAFADLRGDTTVAAIVLHGSGAGFSAGGDRKEFGTPDATAKPTLSRDVLSALEACGKPVIAALHGFAVGGGLELALACDARVATASTRIGLPEVKIGLFPLSGSQRLPRLIGIEQAAQLMLDGTTFTADADGVHSLFDQIVARDEDLLPVAIEVARTAVAAVPLRARDRPFAGPDPMAELQRVLRNNPESSCTAPQWALLQAITAAVEAPDFQSGLERAQTLFDDLGGNRRAFNQ